MGRAHEVRAASMAKTAAKKSAANGRAAKEIYMAAKNGGTDPTANLTLRTAIEKAKAQQVPNDVIQRAIKRVTGGDATNYIINRYEALGPGGVGVIIDVLTSNVNRAAAQIREVLKKNHANPEGKVAFLFQEVAVFAFKNFAVETVLESLVLNDVEVDDVVDDQGVVFVYAPFKFFNVVKAALDELGVKDYLIAEVKMLPLGETLKINDDEKKALTTLLEKLDELEDVQNVYHNGELEK